MDNDSLANLARKKDFIDRVSYAISGKPRIGVTNATLEAYEDDHGNVVEYLVVTYIGGAITARNCTVNSNTANFRELANLLDGGYYEEVANYTKVKNTWKKII